MKGDKIILLFIISIYCFSASAQRTVLKNDIILDATASLNLGVEFKMGTRNTLNVPVSFNSWDYSSDKKFKHIAVQPEFRWWTCEAFTGHFWGFHGHYAFYNVGGIGPFKTIKDNRYEGWLAGAGINYGYSWILGRRWSLEATVGLGYAYMSYEKRPCGKCQPVIGDKTKHYFGPTKLGLAIIFFIN